MDIYQMLWISQVSVLLGLVMCCSTIFSKPLESGSSQRSSSVRVPGGCVRYLHYKIERCLTRYEQILVTYRAESTDEEQRNNLRPSFCHQYQVTLQCLHEELMECPPQSEHLNLIEVRLGYLKNYMHITCTMPQQNNTPRPTRPTTSSKTTSKPTTPIPTTTENIIKTTQKVKTTQLSKETSTSVYTKLLSTSKQTETISSMKDSGIKDIENNKINEYTIINAVRDVTVAPPGVKPTSYEKTKLQLIFSHHDGKSDKERNQTHKKDRKTVPVMIITKDGHENSVVQAQMSQRKDCSVDEQGKIDIRCVFSSARSLKLDYISLALTLFITLLTISR